MKHFLTIFILLLNLILLTSCTAVAVTGAVVSGTVAVTGATVKTTGKAVGVLIPDGDNKDDDE